MEQLQLIGLNHTTAPLEVRERLAFDAAQRRDALASLRKRFADREAVLISTCNRVELYTAGQSSSEDGELIDFLAEFRSVPASEFQDHLYRKSDRSAVEHLFSVSSSLDSMVLGETQILGQVREAYELACQLSATGAILNPLFQRALAVGKQVMHETALAEGRLSIASVAVDYARRIFETLADKTVLSIGAGKMAGMVLQSFAALSPGRLIVCNRDAAKAQLLAGRFAAQPVPFDALADHLVAADVVVSSTGSAHPIVSRAFFEQLLKRRRYRPIFFIDIAVPRDIDPAVGEVENVYLYNMDDLQKVVSNTQSQRRETVDAARQIVARQVDDFIQWHRQRELGPTIDRLYQRFHALAREELARTLSGMASVTDEQRAQLEELTRRTVNKLLHGPVQTLRQSHDSHAPMPRYLHAMEKLFQLEQLRPEDVKPPGLPPDQP